MKALINLESTIFDFKKIIDDLPMGRNNKLLQMKDFGTIFVGGIEKVPAEDLDWIEREVVMDAPAFFVPESWRMPQIIKSLGAFPSATAAAKNGWNIDVPFGFSEHMVRVNKMKGFFWVWRAKD